MGALFPLTPLPFLPSFLPSEHLYDFCQSITNTLPILFFKHAMFIPIHIMPNSFVCHVCMRILNAELWAFADVQTDCRVAFVNECARDTPAVVEKFGRTTKHTHTLPDTYKVTISSPLISIVSPISRTPTRDSSFSRHQFGFQKGLNFSSVWLLTSRPLDWRNSAGSIPSRRTKSAFLMSVVHTHIPIHHFAILVPRNL